MYENQPTNYHTLLKSSEQTDSKGGLKTILQFESQIAAIYVYLWYDNAKMPAKFMRNAKIKKKTQNIEEEGNHEEEEEIYDQ